MCAFQSGNLSVAHHVLQERDLMEEREFGGPREAERRKGRTTPARVAKPARAVVAPKRRVERKRSVYFTKFLVVRQKAGRSRNDFLSRVDADLNDLNESH